MSDDLRVIPAVDGNVGTITLNHPKANSYDLGFMKELDSAIESMRQNDSVKVVVVKSELEKSHQPGYKPPRLGADYDDEDEVSAHGSADSHGSSTGAAPEREREMD